MFANRAEAGKRLAEALGHLAKDDVVALAVPRGGVEVGVEVASRHGWPLDVVIPRKIGAPHNPELGLGAIAPGVRVLDDGMLRTLGVSEEYLQAEIGRQEDEIHRRTEAYRRGRAQVALRERTVVVVDDGIATGGTAIAAVRWAKAQGAKRVILAVPVAPREAVARLSKEADEVVALATPEPFFAVGQWYGDFPQVEDSEVVRLLDRVTR